MKKILSLILLEVIKLKDILFSFFLLCYFLNLILVICIKNHDHKYLFAILVWFVMGFAFSFQLPIRSVLFDEKSKSLRTLKSFPINNFYIFMSKIGSLICIQFIILVHMVIITILLNVINIQSFFLDLPIETNILYLLSFFSLLIFLSSIFVSISLISNKMYYFFFVLIFILIKSYLL